MAHVNWIAALVAGVVGFFPGALWYSDLLFLKAWQRETGLTGRDSPTPPRTRILVGLLLSIVAALLFAWLIGPRPTLSFGLIAGVVTGIGFIAPSFAIQYLFEGRSMRLALINGGYHTVQFLIFGLVLGLWH